MDIRKEMSKKELCGWRLSTMSLIVDDDEGVIRIISPKTLPEDPL